MVAKQQANKLPSNVQGGCYATDVFAKTDCYLTACQVANCYVMGTR